MHNYSYASNGRIWLIWKSGIQVQLIGISDQSVTCRIQNSQVFCFNGIYSCNEGITRRRLWNHLTSLHSIISEKHWILSGDFNIIAKPLESF